MGHGKGFVGRDSGHSGGHPRRTESGFVAPENGRARVEVGRAVRARGLLAWADALHMIAQRNPAVAEVVVESMRPREPGH